MNEFIDIFGYKIEVTEYGDWVEINITGKENHMFSVVLNNYKAQELGKAIINASGGLKL